MARSGGQRSQAYRILHSERNRFEIHLAGELGEADVAELESEFMETLRGLGVSTPHVILNLGELTGCGNKARYQLAQLQRKLAGLGARTSYVTQVPRFRGVGLWVASKSRDPNARAFHDRKQAERWLDRNESRLDRVERRWAASYARRTGTKDR